MKKKTVQNAVKKKLKHFVTFRSSKLAEQLLPVTKALANGSVKKAVTLLLNTSDTKIKENATKAIQYVIDRECYSFSDRDMNIQLQKTATSELENFDLQKIQRDFETHAPLLWACASQELKHQRTAKHLILLKFVQLSVYWFKGGQEFLILLVAIVMYNNQLQKDAFSVLSNLGFFVSHTTVNAKLNIAKSQNEKLM